MTHSRTIVFAAALLGAVVGCASRGTPYPSASQGTTGSSGLTAPDTSLTVPAGATLVASSTTPPLPSFTIPGPGMLFIYDATAGKVAKVTTVGHVDGPINLSSMPDVGAVLNTDHQYNVYYVPWNQATTLPAPLKSSS